MISDALGYLRREVINDLGLADGDVLIGNVHTLKNDKNIEGLILSLVNQNSDSANARDGKSSAAKPIALAITS